MAKGPFKLKLTKLSWLSSVDAPAQGDGARALLIKSDGTTVITARVSKMSDDLGLIFGHAFAASLDGGATAHVDSQNDAIDPDFLKTAMEFVEAGGASDVNHDFESDGRVVFAWPLIPEVNDALGIKSDVVGLAVAVKPSAATYSRFKSGELTGFSIAGQGERTPLEKRAPDDESIAAAKSAASLARKSPRVETPAKKVSKMTLEEALAEIAELKAKLAELDKSKMDLEEVKDEAEKRATLTDAQRSYLKSLDKADAKAFLAKSMSERESDVAKALTADPVEVEFNGQSYRKSAGPAVIELAKAAKAQAEQLAKRDEEISKAEISAVTKATIPNFPGLDEVREYLIKSVRSGGGNAELVKSALESLKGANSFAEQATKAKGFGGTNVNAGTPAQALNSLVEKFATENKVPFVKARAAVMETDEGLRLYAESESRK